MTKRTEDKIFDKNYMEAMIGLAAEIAGEVTSHFKKVSQSENDLITRKTLGRLRAPENDALMNMWLSETKNGFVRELPHLRPALFHAAYTGASGKLRSKIEWVVSEIIAEIT